MTPHSAQRARAYHVAEFTRWGFAVIGGFVTKAEVRRLRPLVQTAAECKRSAGCERPNNTLLPLRWHDAIVQLILADERRLQLLRNAVSAEDLKWISGYISIKNARSPALWWHQDWWCWDHPVTYRRPAPQVALLCYLCDTTPSNGALRVLPGSHLRSCGIHATLPEAHGHEAGDLDPAHAAMSDLPGQETLPVAAGDAVVLDYRLLHGTHGNATETRRDCVLLSFAPSWHGLPADVKAHLIQHPAQPAAAERACVAPSMEALLPRYDGEPRSLALNRNAPAQFEAHE